MIFKELTRQDFRTASTVSNQLVDILQDDTATPEKRKRYQNWYAASQVSGADEASFAVVDTVGTLRQVISGLFQTVHDIDHTQQTSNPLMDMTFGIRGHYSIDESTGSVDWEVPELDDAFVEFDGQGKAIWEQRTLMMNEKLDSYKQMASQLLGDRDASFKTKLFSDDADDIINYPLFLSFKRLFFRDGIKRGTFAMRLYRELNRPLSVSADSEVYSIQPVFPYWQSGYSPANDDVSDGEIIITDTQAAGVNNAIFGGGVGVLRVVRYDNDDPSSVYSPFGSAGVEVGLIFYDSGIVVLDAAKLFDVEQKMAGYISTLLDNGLGADYSDTPSFSQTGLSASDIELDAIVDTSTPTFLPVSKRLVGLGAPPDFTLLDLFVEGSLDDILDHLAGTRFISEDQSNLSAITFQNLTKIKSMLVFCRVAPGEFNYSNNPTYTNEAGEIVARDDDGVKPFSYITKVGLYSANNDLLAVASLSRPIENGPDRDLTLRLRLDF